MTDEKPKYVSQFCANGGHDGVKVLNHRGTLLPSCRFRFLLDRGIEVICYCDCHADMLAVLKMMRDAGRDMPTPVRVVETHSEVSAIAEELAAIRKPPFQPTESGRLAPGQLEQWVYEVMLLEIEGIELTIDYIAMEISLAHHPYRPSAGAIQNVLQAWADSSYIKLGYRPIRVLEKYEALKQVPNKVKRPIFHRPPIARPGIG